MSWVPGADESIYNVHNLPYGVFSVGVDATRRIGVRIGDFVVDLHAIGVASPCSDCATCTALAAPTLNPLMALGRDAWATVRGQLQDLLTDEANQSQVPDGLLIPVADITMHMPFAPADYVDFYSSEYHASNVGRIFRPDSEPLMPNWKHLPIGYHGRSGTIVVSGTEIPRPRGQRRAPDGKIVFGPSTRLDIEAEVGFVVGLENDLGEPLTCADFADHVFGVVLVNDWSARDIQAWEYQPLGPFLGKSFATSISAWVTPLEALAAARSAAPVQNPAVLPYLTETDRYGYDLRLTVTWNDTAVSHPPFAEMYWTPAQQLAHLTANGALVRTGDLYASGTVSGPRPDQLGSFLELTWGGNNPVRLAGGDTRTFLEDGDTVTITATAPGPRGSTIGLGEVTGRIIAPPA